MEQGLWNRVGPVAGLAFVVSFAAFYVVNAAAGPDWVGPDSPAEEVAAYLDEQRDALGIWPAVLLALGVLALVVFVADLHQRYRHRVPESARWLPTAFLAGGLLVAVAFMISGSLYGGAHVFGEVGEDVQAARALHALSTASMASMVPGLVLLLGAAAAMSFRFDSLPRWTAILALVALVVGVVAYWAPVWALWVLAVSIVLLIRPEAAGRPPAAGRDGG